MRKHGKTSKDTKKHIEKHAKKHWEAWTTLKSVKKHIGEKHKTTMEKHGRNIEKH